MTYHADDDENWEAEISQLDGLTPGEKEESKQALRQVTKLLERSLSSLIQERHPITRYILVNHAPWTWKWLVSFVEAVNMALTQSNGNKIIGML
jgi:hypothetical protein